MLCVKCKKEIADGSAFCNWCGKKQATENANLAEELIRKDRYIKFLATEENHI